MSCKTAEAVNDILGAVGWRLPNNACGLVRQAGVTPECIALVQPLVGFLLQQRARRKVRARADGDSGAGGGGTDGTDGTGGTGGTDGTGGAGTVGDCLADWLPCCEKDDPTNNPASRSSRRV